MRIPFFRIFYSTSFTVLSLALAVLLLITPGNLIYEAFKKKHLYSIFIVAGVYILTFIVSILLYASRLYNNRRALLHIPKDWSPLEKGKVEKRVRKLVEEKLNESALTAYQSRPRDLSKDAGDLGDGECQGSEAGAQSARAKKIPPWGTISHPGWPSPSSPDLPFLQFDPIILELPNLIEAKAVSLAPPDPLYDPATTEAEDGPIADALIVDILQRPTTMGLREYFAQLTALGILESSHLTIHFLKLYEKARFAGSPITETEFRHLMAMFADILRSMRPLDPDLVAQLRADNESFVLGEGIKDDDAMSFNSSNTVQHNPTPQPESYHTPLPKEDEERRYSLSSGSEAGSEGTVRTAPLHSASRSRDVSKASLPSSSARWRQQQQQQRRRRTATPSGSSMRKVESRESGSLRSQRSEGSVIRLAEARTPLDLPYTFVVDDDDGGGGGGG
ncbi:MAG: hypothetical protein Q9222_005059 [Ikaeria aurantiellina]